MANPLDLDLDDPIALYIINQKIAAGKIVRFYKRGQAQAGDVKGAFKAGGQWNVDPALRVPAKNWYTLAYSYSAETLSLGEATSKLVITKISDEIFKVELL